MILKEKFLTIPHSGGTDTLVTCLYKIGPNVWSWDGILLNDDRVKSSGDPKKLLTDRGLQLKEGYEYHKLDAVGLKSYIMVMERIYIEKSEKRIDFSKDILWLSSQIPVKVIGKWREPIIKGSIYDVSFYVPNKYRKYWDLEAVIKKAGYTYDPSRHGTDESYGGIDLWVLEEDMKQYVEDLIEEYERETGEKYERLKKKT